MVRCRLAVPVLAFALAGCATTGPRSVSFELGDVEFHGGDRIAIEEVRSMDGALAPGSVVTVRGTYELASRQEGTLYFGTTVRGGRGEGAADPLEHCRVARGSGTFELQHRIPADGWLHVTLYDVHTGAPFGGVYFGQGRGVLSTKGWSYAN